MTHAIRTTVKNNLIAVVAALGGMLGIANSTLADEALESADLLTVVVASGRSFSGEVDVRTSDAALVLRVQNGGASIRRPIRWDRIVSARVGDREVPLAELKAEAGRIATEFESVPITATALIPEFTVPETPAPRVTSIAFDAALGNWDADVEADGLLLQLSASDAWGGLAPTSGTLQVELYAPVRQSFDLVPQGNGFTTNLIGRWTVAVRPEMFGEDAATFRLPFQALQPEFNTAIYWYGLVNVRLAVPGSGVFERSQDGISLRPFAPVRDALQINTGRRFLPSELTGRGKNYPTFIP